MVQRVTAPRSHVIQIERRTEDGFITLGPKEEIAPSEPIRIGARGAGFAVNHKPEYIITTEAGSQVFQGRAGVFPGGNTWIDLRAPSAEGSYLLVIHARNFPRLGLPFTHEAQRTFVVSRRAGPPASGPPDGGFTLPEILGDVKTIAIVGTIAVALVVVGGFAKNLSQVAVQLTD